MASSIRNRLRALETQREAAGETDGEELNERVTEKKRQAACLSAWVRHRTEGHSLESVLPGMLRYVGEDEAKRLLAMDYDAIYRSIGLTIFQPQTVASQSEGDGPVKQQIRMPGNRRGLR